MPGKLAAVLVFALFAFLACSTVLATKELATEAPRNDLDVVSSGPLDAVAEETSEDMRPFAMPDNAEQPDVVPEIASAESKDNSAPPDNSFGEVSRILPPLGSEDPVSRSATHTSEIKSEDVDGQKNEKILGGPKHSVPIDLPRALDSVTGAKSLNPVTGAKSPPTRVSEIQPADDGQDDEPVKACVGVKTDSGKSDAGIPCKPSSGSRSRCLKVLVDPATNTYRFLEECVKGRCFSAKVYGQETWAKLRSCGPIVRGKLAQPGDRHPLAFNIRRESVYYAKGKSIMSSTSVDLPTYSYWRAPSEPTDEHPVKAYVGTGSLETGVFLYDYDAAKHDASLFRFIGSRTKAFVYGVGNAILWPFRTVKGWMSKQEKAQAVLSVLLNADPLARITRERGPDGVRSRLFSPESDSFTLEFRRKYGHFKHIVAAFDRQTISLQVDEDSPGNLKVLWGPITLARMTRTYSGLSRFALRSNGWRIEFVGASFREVTIIRTLTLVQAYLSKYFLIQQ